ncbi:MAG: HAMP domain-containing protein, partial [Treponema sp.]|nr:HAMP domain-containing protein [Treponema sp.]
MKLKYRLSVIVIAILVTVVTAISIILLRRSSSMQMATARRSQERLAAEQARIIQIRYEGYLRVARTMANMMADFDSAEAGRQRNRFDKLMESVLTSEERVVGIFAVFKPNTIDPGMDAAFAGSPGSTETGQWANWYTKRSGGMEHLVYNDIPTIMAVINGPNARKDMIYDPVPQTVAGKPTYVIRMTVPVIQRRTGEVVGRVGVNVNTAYLQPVVDNILDDPDLPDISAMTIYTDDSTIIASYSPDHIGKKLRDAQLGLFNTELDQAEDAVIIGKKVRFSEYSQLLKKNLEVILFPFTIGETGASWAMMMSTEKDVILADINAMRIFTVILSTVSALLTAVIIFFVSTSSTRPIVKVALTLKDISEGEGDLTKTVDINSKDEIGDMARYFNATLEKIKNLVITIKSQTAALFDIGNELASNMTQTAAAINEITANIQSIKSRVINQSASVTETGETMEQMT